MLQPRLLLLPLLAAAALAQPAFEVASIKPNAANDNRVMIGMAPGGRFTATGVNLRILIMQAFNVRDHQITGLPGWALADRYDVNAKAEGGVDRIPQDQFRLMLQALLKDRFQLKFHNETKEMQVYDLVVGKDGHKLKPNTAGGENQQMMRMGRGQLSATGITVAGLAQQLTSALGRTVIDKTGLTGQFDFTLEFTPEAAHGGMPGLPPPPPGTITGTDAGGPTIFTAVQEQLGLKLESGKGPVPLLVVDSVSKPTEN
jgi:uncharacterized protein (TIGR03435 family)